VFTAALAWTDGTIGDVRGHSYLALNARHETFARTTDLVATVANELIHDAQATRNGSGEQVMSPIGRTLYHEGAAVFGVQLLFWEIGTRALGIQEDRLPEYASAAPEAAKELVRLIEARAPAKEGRRLFQSGVEDQTLPPKMGYYLGDLIFNELAKSRGSMPALRIAPEEFEPEALRILKARVPAPPAAP
jgi:hypothetical protein